VFWVLAAALVMATLALAIAALESEAKAAAFKTEA
jgi:hypothetical protein